MRAPVCRILWSSLLTIRSNDFVGTSLCTSCTGSGFSRRGTNSNLSRPNVLLGCDQIHVQSDNNPHPMLGNGYSPTLLTEISHTLLILVEFECPGLCLLNYMGLIFVWICRTVNCKSAANIRGSTSDLCRGNTQRI